MQRTTVQERESIAQSLLGKSGTFKAYFKLYDNLAAIGVPADQVNQPNHVTHHVLKVAEFLKNNTRRKLDEVIDGLATTFDSDIKYAINLAVQCMLMVDSEARNRHAAGYTLGGCQPALWLGNETFLEFARKVFRPATNDSDKFKVDVEKQATMKAWKLQNRLGIRFRGTDNLAEHLLHDDNNIYLFHHVSFLKAQLESFQGQAFPLNCDMATSLARGKLPPQLLVETLHSLQEIMFPSTDDRSANILDELIRNEGFDEDCEHYEGYRIFQETPETFEYLYWGKRIAAIHRELTETLTNRPTSKLERWVERHSSERNALIIALVALLITIVTGIISIGLAAFQSWIAYMAWKYPAALPNSTASC